MGGAEGEAKPGWLRVRMTDQASCRHVRDVLKAYNVRSVCDPSHCPNLGECWSERSVTFMILGESCSRSCRFCAVPSGMMRPPDPDEPERIALAVSDLKLDHVVITSVSRDDLPDKGAGAFAGTIEAVRRTSDATVEVLVPDLGGDDELLSVVLNARPDVLGHNVETVRRLQAEVRDPRSSYDVSLGLLRRAKDIDPRTITKSSLMLGLGENDDELKETLVDLREAGVDIVTMGQYLHPARAELPVAHYIAPEEFDRWRKEAEELGFSYVSSGPLVRSSYKAAEAYRSVRRGE